MKKLICPQCGKELINLTARYEPRSGYALFLCDDCGLDIQLHPGTRNPLLINDDKLCVEWVNLDEGLSGDYNVNNPDDVKLLRFDVSYNAASKDEDLWWENVEDASYATKTPADTDTESLLKLLYVIFKEYRSRISEYPEVSLKKLGEDLSHISPSDIKKKRRYFVDMDGVLAVFNFEATMDDLLSEGYWINRPFHKNMVEAVINLVLQGEEVYIITARLEDAKTAVFEKNGWVDLLLPMISEDKRIFTLCGQDKIKSVPDFDPATDILIDDYSPNCKAWKEHGGNYIKVSRDAKDAKYERTKHSNVIHPDMSPESLVKAIKEV